MLQALLGRKIGMTQLFNTDGKVTPVTVINVGHWVVTQVKNQAVDGYTALQVGLVKEKYQAQSFSPEWLKGKQEYFSCVREIICDDEQVAQSQVGQVIMTDVAHMAEGDNVSVSGVSKGLGFQGVIKRWGFSRGPETHGSNFHRAPGALSYLRRGGEVQKGRRLPGRDGGKTVTVKGLKIVKIDVDSKCLFVSGAIPGKKDSVVEIKKQG